MEGTEETVEPKPKVRKRSAAAGVVGKVPELLDVGDTIEHSITVEYRHPRKGNYWVKCGATTTIRDGETPNDAKARLDDFVGLHIWERIEEVKS